MIFRTVWHYSALKTGVAYLPMVATIMVMAGVSAQLVPRINEHSTYAGGLLGPLIVTAAGLGMLFIAFLAMVVTIAMIRVTREDLAGVQATPGG